VSEPRRLLERTESALERALLEAGTARRSSPAARTRTLAALGLAGSVALSTNTAGGVFWSLLAKLEWTKLAASAAIVAGALPSGYYVWQRYHARLPTSSARAAEAAQVEIRPSEQPAAPELPRLATSESPVATPAAGVARPASARPDVALAAELGALDAVRVALAQDDPGRALSLLDAYSRSYPRGQLELEAEVLRIDALARVGQRDVAKQRAETFLKRQPNSALAARVRGHL
jgi:hypothetical protein